MARDSLDSRELGHYFTLAQVGLEMVVPIVVGVWLDGHFGWSPWGVVVGAVLGLATGLIHLVALANRRERQQRDSSKQPPQEPS
jgi:F0F1-type ATP synthase assembly protein I